MKARSTAMVFASVYLAVFCVAAAAVRAEEVSSDVMRMRSQYYEGLQRGAEEASQGLAIRHDEYGNAIDDEAHRKALEIYRQRKAAEAQRVRSEGRDAALKAIEKKSGIAPEAIQDTGTGPDDPNYRRGFGDRDRTVSDHGGVSSTKHLNAITDAARNTPGTRVSHGPGYVYLEGEDALYWDSNKVIVSRNADGEVVVTPKKSSATETLDRIHDKEVVLGHEKPSVAQLVKKCAKDFEDAERTTQERWEATQRKKKTVAKALKAVDPKGENGIVSEDTRNAYDDFKAGRKDVDDITSPFDKPEAQQRKLNLEDSKDLAILRKALTDQREQRVAELARLRQQARVAQEKLRQTTDGGEASRHQAEVDENDRAIRKLLRQHTDDEMTLNVVAKRNARVANQVVRPAQTVEIDPESDLGTPIRQPDKLTARKALVLSGVAKTFGVVTAYLDESEASVREHRPFSQAKLAVNIASNLTGITHAATAVKQAYYESDQGVADYLEDRIERELQQGFDVSKNPKLLDTIAMEAALRGSVRTIFQGSKGIPLLGDGVMFYENMYNWTYSFSGAWHDVAVLNETKAENRGEQADQVGRSVGIADKTRDALAALIAKANGCVEIARDAARAAKTIDKTISDLEERIRQARQTLEKLASTPRSDNPASDASPLPEETLRLLGPAAIAEIKLAQGFTRDCDSLIKQYRDGDLPRSELQEQQAGLRRRLEAIDVEYSRLMDLRDAARESIRQVAGTLDAQVTYRLMMADFDQARAIAENEERLAQSLAANHKTFSDTLREFQQRKAQFRAFCNRFLSSAVGDAAAKDRLREIEGEVIPLSINQYHMDDYVSLPADLKLQASRLKMLIRDVPPAPPEDGVPPARLAQAQQTAERLNAIAATFDEMTQAVETARERFKQLRELAPLDNPLFQLAARPAGNLAYEFTLSQTRVPQGRKLIYVWDFGDQQGGPTEQPNHRHTYAAPGKHTVAVRVFAEGKQTSEQLGEASITIGDAPIPGTPAGPSPIDAGNEEPAFLITGDMVGTTGDGRAWQSASTKDAPHTWGTITFIVRPGDNTVRTIVHLRRGPYGTLSTGVTALAEPTATWDPTSRRVQTQTATLNWHLGVFEPAFSGGAYRKEAIEKFGADPAQLSWNFHITGELDWRNGRTAATRGRLETNPQMSGTWQVTAEPFLYVKRPKSLMGNTLRNPINVWLVLFPSESEAKTYMQQYRGRPASYAHEPEDDVIEQSPTSHVVRIGRWIARSYWGSGPPSDRHQSAYQRLRAYIQGPGQVLERAVPAGS